MGTVTYRTVEDCDQLVVFDETLRPLLTNPSGSSVEVFDTRGPAGAGPPPHRHPWEEIYFVLDGEIEVVVGAMTHRVKPGGIIHVPAGVGHGYRNLTEAPFLTIVTAGGASTFFSGASKLIAEDPDDLAGLVELARSLGVEDPE